MEEANMKINRKFKDTIFRYIFSDPDEFRGLYTAITGRDLGGQKLEFYDLESIFMSDWRNDISFVTEDRSVIILVEHQSTNCANMVVRCLVYYADLVKRLYAEDEDFKSKIYGGKSVTLPRPEFYVIDLSGTDIKEDKLSLHFEDKNPNWIDVTVRIIDANYRVLKGNSKLKKSKSLEGFSFLAWKFQVNKKYMSNADALDDAIRECKARGYLVDYLSRKEFLIMADNEFTINDYVKVVEKEAREEGRAEGREEGRAEGRAEGREEGREEGRAEFIHNMYEDGVSIEIIAKVARTTVEDVRRIVAK